MLSAWVRNHRLVQLLTDMDMMSCFAADLPLENVMGNERSQPFPARLNWEESLLFLLLTSKQSIIFPTTKVWDKGKKMCQPSATSQLHLSSP